MSKTYYGCIDQDEFQLSSPRAIDWDECESLSDAFKQALEIIESGESLRISVVRVKYYGPDGNGYWGEDPSFNPIEIDARDAEWAVSDSE